MHPIMHLRFKIKIGYLYTSANNKLFKLKSASGQMEHNLYKIDDHIKKKG